MGASHSIRRPWLGLRWRSCCCCASSFDSDEPIIELDTQATILTTKRAYLQVLGARGDEISGDMMMVSSSLWQKDILMGNKCKLPDYSGTIIYDSAGRLVPPKTTTSRVANAN